MLVIGDALEESGEGNTESLGYSADDDNAGIPFSSFDTSDVAPI
jgi:hypothetical protein